MAANTIVVIRHLTAAARPVASYVYTIKPSDGVEPGCEFSFLNEKADAHIEKFQKQFPEFTSAMFHKDVLEI